MLPIKIINRSANKYQLAKHNVTDTNKVLGLVVHLPAKTRKFTPRGKITPRVPQIKKCCSRTRQRV